MKIAKIVQGVIIMLKATNKQIFELEKENTQETVKNELIENPCYHCYEGASGQCYMTHCKHQFEEWAKDVESEYVKIN